MTTSARIATLELAIEGLQLKMIGLLAANERQASQIAALLLTRSPASLQEQRKASVLGPINSAIANGPLHQPTTTIKHWTEKQRADLKAKLAGPMSIQRIGLMGLEP